MDDQAPENLDCREALLLIQASFDSRIDAHQAVLLSTHRAQCLNCDQVYRRLRRVRAEAQGKSGGRKSSRHALEERLRASALARGDVAPPSPPRAHRRLMARLRPYIPKRAVAVSFLLGMVVASTIAALIVVPGLRDTGGAVLGSHYRAAQPGHLSDVVTSSDLVIRDFFTGKLDFGSQVPLVPLTGTPMIGARLDYLDGHPVAVTLYRSDRRTIEIYCWPLKSSERGILAAVTSEQRGPVGLVHWREQEMAIWVVSEMDAEALHVFAADWRHRLEASDTSR